MGAMRERLLASRLREAFLLPEDRAEAIASGIHSIDAGSMGSKLVDSRSSSPDIPMPIVWEDGRLRLLDQTRIPDEIVQRDLTSVDQVANAIASMQVRGAPAIGLAGAAGMALAALEAERIGSDPLEACEQAHTTLIQTRPTAVDLRWALDGCLDLARRAVPEDVPTALSNRVSKLLAERLESDLSLAGSGADLLPSRSRILTHCNTGGLATGGVGTALGIIRLSWERGSLEHVYVDETRPRLQGARLTTWELQQQGIPFTLIPDSAAASLMAAGKIDAVIVGADRVAANGDVANKIGTYSLAVNAAHHRLPFYVAAPWSTIDLTIVTGSEIPIEQRSPDEVLYVGDERIAPAGVEALNLAFDVTPAELVTAVITERGVLRAPYREMIVAMAETEKVRANRPN